MRLCDHRIMWGLTLLLVLFLVPGTAFARPGRGGGGRHRGGVHVGAYRGGVHVGGGYRGGGFRGGVHAGGFHGGSRGGIHVGGGGHGGHRGPSPRYFGGRHWWPRYWHGVWGWSAVAPSWVYAPDLGYGYYYYYCPPANAFYPDVSACPVPWQYVPSY